MSERLSRFVLWFLGVAILLQFILPFIYPIVGDDSWVHLNWLEQFPQLFRESNLYPRWLPDGFWGFGSPAFYFYPPLTYWIAGIISFIFPQSPLAIYQILELIGTAASIVTCYWYLRSVTILKNRAIIGAVIYGIFPYRIIDLYLRNALSEHLSFIFLPIILLGIEIALHIRAKEKNRIFLAIAISAIGWAGMLLVNVPVAIITIYFVPIYSFLRAKENSQYRNLLSPALGTLIGCMISFAYYIPANMYRSAIKLSHLWDVQKSDWNIIYTFKGIFEGDHRYFSFGIAVTFLIGAWLFIQCYSTKKEQQRNNLAFIFFIYLLFSVFIQIPFLFFHLFRIFPFFTFIQFSFRWDILIVLASAYYVANMHDGENIKSVERFIVVITGITVLIGVGYYFSATSLHWEYQPTSEHMDAPEYLPATSVNNFVFAKDSLRSHAMDPLILPVGAPLQIHSSSIDNATITFSTGGSAFPTHIIFHRMYFPAWRLRMANGTEIPITSDSIGRINAIIPSEPASYILSLEKSTHEKMGNTLSIIGLSLLVITFLFTIFWRKREVF